VPNDPKSHCKALKIVASGSAKRCEISSAVKANREGWWTHPLKSTECSVTGMVSVERHGKIVVMSSESVRRNVKLNNFRGNEFTWF
jgi:hypothetical protein